MKKLIKMAIAVVLVISMAFVTFGSMLEEETAIKNDFTQMIIELKDGNYKIVKNKFIGVDMDKVKMSGSATLFMETYKKLIDYGKSLVPGFDKVEKIVKEKIDDVELQDQKELTKSIFSVLNFDIKKIEKISENDFIINLKLTYPSNEFYKQLVKNSNDNSISSGLKMFVGKIIPTTQLFLGRTDPMYLFEKVMIDAYDKTDVSMYEMESEELSIRVHYDKDNDNYCYDCSDMFKQEGEDLVFKEAKLDNVFYMIDVLYLLNKNYLDFRMTSLG